MKTLKHSLTNLGKGFGHAALVIPNMGLDSLAALANEGISDEDFMQGTRYQISRIPKDLAGKTGAALAATLMFASTAYAVTNTVKATAENYSTHVNTQAIYAGESVE